MQEIAEGIIQVALPLPFPLRIVHAYLVRERDGWSVIDTGLNYPPGRAAWQVAFAELQIHPEQINRIFLTHAHPDHYGLAGWLAAQSGAAVLVPPLEQAFAQRTWQAEGLERHAVVESFRSLGVPEELLTAVEADIAALREMTQPAPPAMLPLLPGSSVQLGERVFQVIATPGHSDGHVVLYSTTDRLLFCGDAVLEKITPNVGRWPAGLQNPLAAFLDSLRLLATLDVDLALPGHGPVMTAFGQRVDTLLAHHEERLAHTLAAADGADAYQICTRIFATETLTSHQLRFAMAETLAHLEYLVEAGHIRVRTEVPLHYERTYDVS